MAKVTGLSGNEIFCLALKSFSPGELVVGNSVQSMGFLGSLGAGFKNMVGGEVPQVTQAIHDGRASSFLRMKSEAQQHGASGVAGVAGELRNFSGSTEFLFVGSCVHSDSPAAGFLDRKSTRLNSSHQIISYAVFCLKKKNTKNAILHEY